MLLEHLIGDLCNAAAKFDTWWREKHRTEPDDYPPNMEPHEWYEQFKIWYELEGYWI